MGSWLKALAICTMAMVLAGIGCGVWKMQESAERERAYHEIERGDTKEAVTLAMGTPDAVGRVIPYLWWGKEYIGPNDSVCEEEYRYARFPPPGLWIIGFDTQGRVVSKYYESSP